MGLEIQLGSPIILISVFAVIALVLDGIWKNKQLNYYFTIISLLIVAAFSIYTMMIPESEVATLDHSETISKGMLVFGGFPAFFDLLFAISGVLALFAAKPYIRREYMEINEFYSLFLTSIAGMIYIVHANHLLVLFIGIETMSVSFYVMAGFFRKSIHSVEAALKYFLLGAFITGFLIYGMAMIYGGTGSMDLNLIHSALLSGDFVPIYFAIGFAMLIIAISFKVAAFPFHQWAPDVYHGSPTIIAGFMSTAGKAAAITAFIIIAQKMMPLETTLLSLKENSETIQLIVAIISAITMLLGNITALVQKNVKRMLAYSSVAHAGYLLMGIVANNEQGWSGILFYATAYMLMQLGAFVVISLFERQNQDNDEIKYMQLEDYSGMAKTHPLIAAIMSVFMFSLAGIPPFAGFFGKYYLFAAAIKADFLWLTIIAVISSIISMYYYIGLIIYMYFKDKPEEAPKAQIGPAGITLFVTVAGLIVFGVMPSILIDLAGKLF